MIKKISCLALLILSAGLISACGDSSSYSTAKPNNADATEMVVLPAPISAGGLSLEETLNRRRSVREYSDAALTMVEAGQLLWAAQGQTVDWGGRTAPSAGGLYPLEVYLAAGKVEALAAGVYLYLPGKHALIMAKEGDQRKNLSAAALGQDWVREAPATLVIAAVYARMTGKYGERGNRYVHMEAGHAAQNACLEVTAMGLGGVTVGAFEDEQVRNVCAMPKDQAPLYLIPVGRTE